MQSAATLAAATLPIIEAGAGIDVLLQNITFRNGLAGADQGVINATSGMLWMVDSIVTGSDAAVGGAAIFAGSELKLINVSVTNNTTDGIRVSGGGDIVIVGATVTGNAGTGLTVTTGGLQASYSTFSNNGVGILLQGAPSTIDHTTFDANTGSALVIDTDVSVTVARSTFSNHSATVVDAPGAAIFLASHSTFSNSGPAIVLGAAGTLFLNYVTIVNSGQLAAMQSNTININNSIVMGPSCNNMAIGANNLVDTAGCGSDLGFNIGAPTGVDPALLDNGGPTLTHGLFSQSNALDSASCSLQDVTDQRDLVRPSGISCDIGAFERQN